MVRISSKETFFMKRVFPAIFFGIIALIIALSVRAMIIKGTVPYKELILMPILTVFFWYLIKIICLDVVDEVWDDGDQLRVKVKKKFINIQFENVDNISTVPYSSPRKVRLSLKAPVDIGNEITFIPKSNKGLWGFRRENEIVRMLRKRVGRKGAGE